MTAGSLYTCKWRTNRWNKENNSWDHGWEMLMFLRTETIKRVDGVIITNYRFYDIMSGKERLLDKGLIRYCRELNLEEL